MLENEDLRNDMVIEQADEVNFLVIPEEVYRGEIEEDQKELNGVLIGAVVAATGVVAYKYAPKVLNKVKKMFKNKTNETLEDKQRRLLEELADVNSQLASEDGDDPDLKI